jgi:hypothetical protein
VRVPGIIDLVKVSISYPTDKLTYESCDAGADTPGNQPTVGNPAPGELQVVVLSPSNAVSWNPAEYEVGLLKFRLAPGLEPGILDLSVKVLEIRRNGQRLAFVQPLDGVLFVKEA